jgi:predicted nucleic acid-binding protein
MPTAVFVDTSAFHALQNSGDLLEHDVACRVGHELETERTILVTTDYVLDETYTLLRSVLGHRSAVNFGRTIRGGDVELVQIDEQLQADAWRIFERYGDKDFSFTDCTSFAVMRKAGLRVAFTLDRHFQQFGFETLPTRLPLRKR